MPEIKDDLEKVTLPTLKEYDVSGKNVLVRVDLNVPMHNGRINDFSRLVAIRDTVSYLLKHQAKVILLSHFGRPQPENNPTKWDLGYSLEVLVPDLASVLGHPVHFIPHYAGPLVSRALSEQTNVHVFLLENIRYAVGEETNSQDLARQLAQGMDLYVNEAFSCSHRAHASLEAITHVLPSVAGFNLQKEVAYLERCLSHPAHPVTAIVGGSKVSTKLSLLENLAQKVDILVIGGAMANTFLAAQGHTIGASVFEPAFLPMARKVLATPGVTLVLPQDVIVASHLEADHGIHRNLDSIQKDEKIFDIGPNTVQHIISLLYSSKTIVWNGPVGAFEYPPFEKGTWNIAQALANVTSQGVLTVAGGGDTLSALNSLGLKDQLSHVSTAGGAFLEWLEGKDLPAIQALRP